MYRSAGIAIILKGEKLLLVHPTNAPWSNTYSIPKGGIDKKESKIDAAIRETREETSINIKKSQISNPDSPIKVEYRDKRGRMYKKVFVFVVHIESLSEIGVDSEILDKENLQLSEVDWGGFLDKVKARDKISWRFLNLLSFL